MAEALGDSAARCSRCISEAVAHSAILEHVCQSMLRHINSIYYGLHRILMLGGLTRRKPLANSLDCFEE